MVSFSNQILYSLYYVEACNELAGPISASLASGNTASIEEMSRRYQAVGNKCVRFDRPEIWISDLLLHRRMRYRSHLRNVHYVFAKRRL